MRLPRIPAHRPFFTSVALASPLLCHSNWLLFVASRIRTLVDPTTAVEKTVNTYSSLMVVVAPIECRNEHSFPAPDGSACVCSSGFYRREFGEGWSCKQCGGGFQPRDGTRCEACTFGKHSADGEQCLVCGAGYQPNQQVGANACVACDETSISDGTECTRCPTDQVAEVSRTHCAWWDETAFLPTPSVVCKSRWPLVLRLLFCNRSPGNMYNSSLWGGITIRCLKQELRGEDQRAAICMPCGALECVTCGVDGVVIRPEFAVAQSDQPWLVFRCPQDGACVQDAGTGQRCKVGHTGLLCGECSPEYGLDRDDCVKCSATNSSPLAVGGMLAAVCLLAGLIYLWHRRSKRLGSLGAETAISGELSEALHTNPLHPRESQGGSSSGTGKAVAIARKSTDIYMLMRVVYQPVRIIIGYIQVNLSLLSFSLIVIRRCHQNATVFALACRS